MKRLIMLGTVALVMAAMMVAMAMPALADAPRYTCIRGTQIETEVTPFQKHILKKEGFTCTKNEVRR